MDIIIVALVIQASTILLMIGSWWKKPSTIKADPTSIVGVAVVMGHPLVEEEFSSFPAEMTSAQMAKRLRGRKFKLGDFVTANGVTKFGIMPVNPGVGAIDHSRDIVEQKETIFTKLGNMTLVLSSCFPFLNNWRNNRFYFDSMFALLLLGLLALTLWALSKVNKPEIIFLETAAASGTGMRIFFSILGVVVSHYWGRLFRGQSHHCHSSKET